MVYVHVHYGLCGEPWGLSRWIMKAWLTVDVTAVDVNDLTVVKEARTMHGWTVPACGCPLELCVTSDRRHAGSTVLWIFRILNVQFLMSPFHSSQCNLRLPFFFCCIVYSNNLSIWVTIQTRMTGNIDTMQGCMRDMWRTDLYNLHRTHLPDGDAI
jgi:hypothetical protein